MWWFMLKCQDIDQSTEEGQCECQITYLHRDLSNFLGQPQNNRVTRGLDPDTFSAGPLHALAVVCWCCPVFQDRGYRDEFTWHVTRDEDTWHVTRTRDNVSWGASPSVPPVQEVPRARGRGAAGPGHPAPPAQWPARHRTLSLEKY